MNTTENKINSSMCQYPNPIEFDGIASIQLNAMPQGVNWQYTLLITMYPGANYHPVVVFENFINLETNQSCNTADLNCLPQIVDIEFKDGLTNLQFSYNISNADYQPCCPAHLADPLFKNCEAAPRATCITISPNKTPIKLDLELSVKKVGNPAQKLKIPYDKARHNG